MPELLFTVATDSPPEFHLLAEALRREVVAQDAVARLVDKPPPPRPDRVYVALGAPSELRDAPQRQRARTIVVSPSQPGSPGHQAVLELAPRVALTLHPNFFVARRLIDRGLRAAHLQLGYTPAWDESIGAERSLDTVEANRIDRLSKAKLALISGNEGPLAFDWLHSLLAIHRGAVVLHEHCFGAAPLDAGRHMFVASGDSVEAVADALLADPERRGRVATEAHRFISELLPMSVGASALLGYARSLLVQPAD